MIVTRWSFSSAAVVAVGDDENLTASNPEWGLTWMLYFLLHIHSLTILLWPCHHYFVDPHFPFNTAAIPLGFDSTRCWKVMRGIWPCVWWLGLSRCVGIWRLWIKPPDESFNFVPQYALRSGGYANNLSKVKSLSCSYIHSWTIGSALLK